MSAPTTFIAYSAVLLVAPLGCITLLILQLLSDKYSPTKITDKSTHRLLYFIYASALCCGINGYALHISTNRVWCEVFGMAPCFALLGASKAFLYLFFLQRAKLAQGMTMSDKCKKILFSYFGPLYLFIHWILYCVLTTILMSGGRSDNAVSHCVFKRWAVWFCIFAGCVDLFNSISSLCLFLYPLLRSMHEIKITNVEHKKYLKHLGYVSAMKWNITLTFVSSISSVTTLFMIPVANQYIWAFCMGDPFINALCTFGMIHSNRKLISRALCGLFCVKNSKTDIHMPSNVPKITHVISNTAVASTNSPSPNCVFPVDMHVQDTNITDISNIPQLSIAVTMTTTEIIYAEGDENQVSEFEQK